MTTTFFIKEAIKKHKLNRKQKTIQTWNMWQNVFSYWISSSGNNQWNQKLIHKVDFQILKSKHKFLNKYQISFNWVLITWICSLKIMNSIKNVHSKFQAYYFNVIQRSVSPIENADRVPIFYLWKYIPQRGQSKDRFTLSIINVILILLNCLEQKANI